MSNPQLTLTSHEPLQEIFETVKPGEMQLADMEKILDRMVEKGGIGRSLKENTHYYYTIPFVVGMYEWQLNKLTPEFLPASLFMASSTSGRPGSAFLRTFKHLQGAAPSCAPLFSSLNPRRFPIPFGLARVSP